MRPRLLLLTTALLTTTLVVLLGGVLREAEPGSGTAAVPRDAAAVADRALAGLSSGNTAAEIERLQAQVRAEPRDGRALGLLGLTYLQRTRETGDASFYPLAERAFVRALAVDSRDALALAGLASLAASRHEFSDSLRLARRAVAAAPDVARGYGLVGDALLQLGRYEQAFRTFDRMVAVKPNLAGYARIAYARELLGRPAAATQALELALDAAGSRAESLAWTHVELGKLEFGRGELRKARRSFRTALWVLPEYVYALDWLARTEAALGRYRSAVRLARRAVDAVPQPQFVATLAEIERARGNGAGAREQYALMRTIERLLAAAGVNSDLELALFRLDHGIRLRETLALARKARAARPSIHGDDTLAWALVRNGRCREALPYSSRSLRLGTKDASFYFHRGMIERCLGRDAEARLWFRRAVRTNPSFSLIWGPVARRYAR